jgi:hypothetical protein
LRRQLIVCLRQDRGTRLPRTRGEDRRGQMPEIVGIHVRPPELKDRVMPGHLEGDFIKGARNKSSVGVLVERSSRLVLLARKEDATAASALARFTVQAQFDCRTDAPELHLRAGQGDESASAVGPEHGRAGVLLRSTRSMAARHLREHQWLAAPVTCPRAAI